MYLYVIRLHERTDDEVQVAISDLSRLILVSAVRRVATGVGYSTLLRSGVRAAPSPPAAVALADDLLNTLGAGTAAGRA